MSSTAPVVLSCETTGATTATCGSLRSTSATLMETGAPEICPITLEPGGCTITSAPIPRLRARASLSMPTISPTTTRISTTSTATATTLISERIGRCTRLATTILFIASFLRRNRCLRLRRGQHLRLAGWGCARRRSCRRSALRRWHIQTHQLRSRRLLQRKLIVAQVLVELQLHHIQPDGIFLLRTADLDL